MSVQKTNGRFSLVIIFILFDLLEKLFLIFFFFFKFFHSGSLLHPQIKTAFNKLFISKRCKNVFVIKILFYTFQRVWGQLPSYKCTSLCCCVIEYYSYN